MYDEVAVVGSNSAQLDEEVQRRMAWVDEKVQATFEKASQHAGRFLDAASQEHARTATERRMDSVRLQSKRAVYGLANGADLAATGTVLSGEVLHALWSELRTRRRIHATEREFDRLTPLTPVVDRTGDEANQALTKHFNASLAEAATAIESESAALRQADRRHQLGLLARALGPTIEFHAIRLGAFAVATALVTKLISLPFAALGWKGVVVGAAIAYLVVQIALTPFLRARFAARLTDAVERLLVALIEIEAVAALLDVEAAIADAAVREACRAA